MLNGADGASAATQRVRMSAPIIISIVTPSFQQAASLERCLASVHDQEGASVEHIVVDGGSTDGSKEIIAAHQERLAWWCSEPDRGQSDALNKGLARATGEVFGWINSDDALLPGALRAVSEAFASDARLQVLEGARIVVEGGRRRDPQNDPADRRALFVEPRINQQAIFFRTALVREAGGVDPALHYVMDLELWWRIMFLTKAEGLRVIDRDLAEFHVHADSKTGRSRERFRHEQAGVLHGLCKLVGEGELARILAIGYQWPAGIRPMPMAADQPALVRAMAVHFLLKWDRHAHEEDAFLRMRALLAWPGLKHAEEDPLLAPRIAEARRSAASPTWTLHRVKRKLHHLFG